MKPVEVDVDAIMLEIGHLGKYQIKLFLWMIFPIVLCSMHDSNYIFTAMDVDYRCRIPECEGINTEFNASWLSNAISEGEKCSRYVYNNSSSNSQEEAKCSAALFDKNKSMSCEEYVFLEEKTFLEEFNIACQSWKLTLVGTMQNVGALLALPLVGALSDRYGRRHAMIISCFATGILGIIKSASVNYGMFLTLESLEPALGSGVYMSTLTLAVEIVIPKMREAISVLINIYYVIGHLLMGFAGWAFPYWRTYLLVMYSPALLIFIYYWIISDSIKWLIIKRRYQEAINILTNIATENNKTLSDKALEGLKFNQKNKQMFDVGAVDVNGNETKHISALRHLLKSKILILRFLKISVVGIATTFCLFGMSINSSTVLMYSRYENYILAAIVEIPGNVISYFSLRFFGRKKTIFTSLLIGGLSLCSFVFLPGDLPWLAVVVYLLGKCCVTCASGSVDLYTAELFPTSLRQTILSTYFMIGTFGSILATQTPLLNKYNDNLATYIFAGSCLFSAALILSTPETLNKRLPETVEDSENIV